MNDFKRAVLVFPPFNNFRRCLIHQFVKSRFENLKTFSIGEGNDRRTVVCFDRDLKSIPSTTAPTLENSWPDQSDRKKKQEGKEESESVRRTIESGGRTEESKKVKRARTMPSVSIYRPPAARRLEQNANVPSIQSREIVKTVPTVQNNASVKYSEDGKDLNASERRNNGISVFRNAISSIRLQNKVSGCKNYESTIKKTDGIVCATNNNVVTESGKNTLLQNKQRKPDIKVYVPKGRRSANQTDNNCVSVSSSFPSSNLNAEIKNCDKCEIKKSENEKKEEMKEVKKKHEVVTVVSEVTQNGEKEVVADEKSIEDEKNEGKTSSLQVITVGQEENSVSEKENKRSEEDVNEIIDLTADVVNREKNDENDEMKVNASSPSEPEISSQSKENSVIVRRTRKSEESFKLPERKNGERAETKEEPSSSIQHLNPDECDWESMFDDTGECLDPSLLEQLTSAVGDVTIEKPETSYDEFKTKSLDLVGDEFPHVIEIYNFPPEFQLQDLMTVFSQFKNSGFEIRWVDDTHALGIFSSSAVVSEVLSSYHPFVKTRSLKDGTTLSKMKARRSAEFLQPYKPRPDTCPALARRLVTGALGVRLPTSREEREAEKKILTKAREKKRLEAKQKEDAWEGTFS